MARDSDELVAYLEEAIGAPVEGFVTRRGPDDRAFQVVFPRDWASFHTTDSFGAFIRSLSAERQAAYAAVKQALMETMSGAEYHDAAFAPELSFRPE